MLSLVPTLLVTPMAYALLDGLAARLNVRRAPAPSVFDSSPEAAVDRQLVT